MKALSEAWIGRHFPGARVPWAPAVSFNLTGNVIKGCFEAIYYTGMFEKISGNGSQGVSKKMEKVEVRSPPSIHGAVDQIRFPES